MNEQGANLIGIARHAPEICTFVMPVFRTHTGKTVHQRVDEKGRVTELKPIALGIEFVPTETQYVVRVADVALVGFEFEPGGFVVGAPNAILSWLAALQSRFPSSPHIGEMTWAAVQRLREQTPNIDPGSNTAPESIWAFSEGQVRAYAPRLETVELVRRLPGEVRTDAEDAVRCVTVALNVAESLMALGRAAEENNTHAENWQLRFGEQLDLARLLLHQVSDEVAQPQLRERLDQLDSSRIRGNATTRNKAPQTLQAQPGIRTERSDYSTPRMITKYPNKKLYDAAESRYITPADIRRLAIDRIDFVVIDKKSREDITRSILLQIIAEQESGGDPLLSRDFLSQIIRSYGGAMQGLLGSFLEQSLKLFASQQRDARDRTNRVSDPGAAEAVNHLAQRNYQRWRSVQDEIYRTLMETAARGRTPEDEKSTSDPDLKRGRED